ncbi:hypothetical protein LCGC14_2895350, partial [marine sediment metagenome]
MVKNISWFSAIPRIHNDVAPNERWDRILNAVLVIFEKGGNARRGERREMKELLESVFENRTLIAELDNKIITEELIKILRPGITTTLLLDDENEIEEIQQEYDGTIQGPYVVISLRNVGPDTKKNPRIRLLWDGNYQAALELLNSKESENAYRALIDSLMVKVELTAFCKGGDRRARWTLDSIHPEYAEEEGCYGVAAKLTFFILDILGEDLNRKNLTEYEETVNHAKEMCMEEFNEQEINFLINTYPPRTCPLCLREINLIDFFRNGRNDPNSIVFGHYEFRGARSGDVHNGKNSFWIHRECNSVQGIHTVEEIIPILENIVRKQREYEINWED